LSAKRYTPFFKTKKLKTLNKQEIINYVLDNPSYFEFMPQEIQGRLNTTDNLSVSDIQKKIIE
jgi:hypothetical protein